MNSLIEKISNLRSGETLLLEKNAVYNVYDDDCVRLTGIYCSNTTTKEENPTDAKKTAIFLQKSITHLMMKSEKLSAVFHNARIPRRFIWRIFRKNLNKWRTVISPLKYPMITKAIMLP